MRVRMLLLIVLSSVFVWSACGSPEENGNQQIDCGDGNAYMIAGSTYCVYTQAITEEGFQCPAMVPHGSSYGDLMICGSGSDRPVDLLDRLQEDYEGQVPDGACRNVACGPQEACVQGVCEDRQCYGAGDCAAGQACQFGVCLADEVQACLDACPVGCPGPGDQPCASDGEYYCNECVIECYGLEVVDASFCEGPPPEQYCEGLMCGEVCNIFEGDLPGGQSGLCNLAGECVVGETPICDLQECLDECGVGCPAAPFQPCATDGNRYCSECVIACNGLQVAEDPTTCGAHTFIVDHYRHACVGEGAQMCLRVQGEREPSFSLFYSEIEGFTHQWGRVYTLQVDITEVEDPPADGSSFDYDLVSVVDTMEVAPGTTFLFPFMPSTESLLEVNGLDLMAGDRAFRCDSQQVCDDLEALIAAGNGVEMSAAYDTDIDDPIIVTAVQEWSP